MITNPIRVLELIRLSKQSKKHQELLSEALDKILLYLRDSGKELGDF